MSFEVTTPSSAVDKDTLKVDVTDTSVTVEFEESGGAKEYVLYEDGVEVGRTDKSPFILEGLIPGSSHEYSMVVENGSGYASSPITFGVDLLPSSLVESAVTWTSDVTSVTFIFEGGVPTGLTYILKDKDDKVVGEIKEGSNTYKLVPLKSGTSYTYTLTVKNKAGESAEALEIVVKTKVEPPVEVPSFSGSGNDGGGVVEPVVEPTKPEKTEEAGNEAPVPSTGEESPVKTFRFVDTSSSFAQNEIEVLAERGIITGVGADRFEPTRTITRMEFAALVVRALQVTPEEAVQLPYQDISTTAWYTKELKAAVAKGIARGFSKTEFAPNRNINREQATRMLVNAEYGDNTQISDAAVLLDMSDVSVWARPAVEKAVVEGLVKGYPDGTFKPQADMTRAEAAMLIYRLVVEDAA